MKVSAGKIKTRQRQYRNKSKEWRKKRRVRKEKEWKRRAIGGKQNRMDKKKDEIYI